MEIKSLQNQKGFTLVEIAIVLVIIGLLLGGVLKGQEIINSSKIKNDTDSLVALQSASYAYRDRMGFFPGTPRAEDPDGNGNKINIAREETSANADIAVPTPGNFFADLTDQGFLKEANFSPAVDDLGFFQAGFAEDGTTAGGTAVAATNANKNYVCITYTASVSNRADIVRGIDIKLDDGVAATGSVRTSTDTACLEL